MLRKDIFSLFTLMILVLENPLQYVQKECFSMDHVQLENTIHHLLESFEVWRAASNKNPKNNSVHSLILWPSKVQTYKF